MKIVISGASGLVGSALSGVLERQGHKVHRLVRPGNLAGSGAIRWDPDSGMIDRPAMEGCDAVVNLNGAGIGESRWTERQKAHLRQSRLSPTRSLVNAFRSLQQKPRAFISASAVGYYGSRGDEILTESSASGAGFLADLAREWESEAWRASEGGIRTVILRFGVILSAKGGALAQMLPPFLMGIGGRLGNGKQWMSWIALDDAVEIIRAAIAHEDCSGPLNAVAPHPVRNVDFTRTLGQVLRRPTIFRMPAFALRLAFGEMADALLLASHRVTPTKLLSYDHNFRFGGLEQTLRAILPAKK